MAKYLETSRVKSWAASQREITAYLDGGPETHFIKQLKRDIEATRAARIWHAKQAALRRKRTNRTQQLRKDIRHERK